MNWRRFTEACRGGRDPWWDCVYHGGGKGAPPAPDYSGAAQQQAQASQQLATQNTWANRPNVNTPWGNINWNPGTSYDPSTGQAVTSWQQNMTLSPQQQAAFDAQQQVQTGRSQAAQGLLGQATSATATPFDWGSLPGVPGSISDAQKSSYQTMEAALQPQRDRQTAALQNQLANSGLGMDSQAFKNAQMDQANQFGQQDRGVLAQAMGQGIQDTQAQQALRQSAIGEQQQKRAMPLNELNALLTGQQVNMPQMPSFAPAAQGQAPNLLGAAQSAGQYGLGAAQMNNNDIGSLIGTGAGLGTLALMGGML